MNNYTIESVSRAIRTLDALARTQPAALPEVAEAVSLSKATVYRVLATLVDQDVVVQDPRSKRYTLGPRLITLGQRALESADAVNAAITESEALADRYQLVLTVNVPASSSVIEAARLPRHGRGEFAPLGTPIPYHASASGLVFLAHSEKLLQTVKDGGLPKLASGTFTHPKRLHRELTQIRDDGYSLVHDTLEEGVTALAAPVFDHHGSVQLTIGATGPSGAMSQDGWVTVAQDVRAAADAVTQRIGGVTSRS
ncbi:MAG TPA: IclR family transcriptional regulator [Actinomycetales bacterium]|nr:IclR family transcriptional regulator [Actinomycetales bacterium]